MIVALSATAIVVLALLWEITTPWMERKQEERRRRREQRRAGELLKSCVNEEEWAMYRDLGFLRVWGGQSDPDGPSELRGVDYAYLIYPHKPIVAYLPQT